MNNPYDNTIICGVPYAPTSVRKSGKLYRVKPVRVEKAYTAATHALKLQIVT
jgi:hypothetical protein